MKLALRRAETKKHEKVIKYIGFNRSADGTQLLC